MGFMDKHVIIVGGGPVGALNACYMARRGYKVDLYESREDIRGMKNAQGRSINLALSHRGIEALKRAGVGQAAIDLGIPMRARMIHSVNGKLYPIPYGKPGQYLLSVDRMKLNKLLLTAASNQPNVNLHFQHKLISCNLEQPSAVFKKEGVDEVSASCDLLCGCDGAYSAVRQQMQRRVFDFSQEYIPHGYKELTIPATKDGEFAMEVEYLHIWPRHQFMLIALPNLDKSFTCTLFMPFSKYENLADGQAVINFFNQVFPDVVPLIGEDVLREDFFALPPLNVVSIKCSPYHYGHTVALFGDAAHAMVPFYGQGLNSGLEDVLVFDEIIERLPSDLGLILKEYSTTRIKDGQAIAELSKQNYIEMRSSVASLWFLFRKRVDNLINILFPSLFTPKYTMVAFTRIPYHQVIMKSKRQDKIVNWILAATGVGSVVVAALVFKNHNHQNFNVADLMNKLWYNLNVGVGRSF